MATNDTSPAHPAPRYRKLRWLIVGAGLTATVAVTGALTPVGASTDPPAPAAGATSTVTSTGLPVSAAQRGPWSVGVNALPPVTGTVSIAGTPTVNVANLPAPTPAPLWQGTPFFGELRFSDPSQAGCHPIVNVPAGMVLFAERASTTMILAPGGIGLSRIEVTPLGGTITSMFLPAERGPSIMELGIKQEVYSGTIDIGLPASDVNVCFFGTGGATINVMGYLVPAP